MYATGGVIGVLTLACSCLMTASTHETGVPMISEGKEAVWGVWSGGRTGLVTAGILTFDNERVGRSNPSNMLLTPEEEAGGRDLTDTSEGRRGDFREERKKVRWKGAGRCSRRD